MKSVEIESGRVGVDVDVIDGDPCIVGRQGPGRDVGVVVEARNKDPVTRLPSGGQGPGNGQGQRRHVGAKGDRVGVSGSQEVSSSLVCCVEHCVTFDAGSKRATVIGVGANKVTV
ncbi:MAG: hypothetical protein CM1200mP2_13020 [Planctomycetaceae bacterium]|nr:MAG: hypothetical protein CM1200mP2_13020 [Planctomycetaceae bacterium]